MFSSLSFTILFLLSLSFNATATPFPSDAAGQSLTLRRRRLPSLLTDQEIGEWAKRHRYIVLTKYGGTLFQKRSTGESLITNQNADSSYFASLAIGTPPTSFDVILDTGSADLWVVNTTCDSGCQNIPAFNPAMSSSFTPLSASFSITYGSGNAQGKLGQDHVQMAGFTVPNQIFAVCDQVSPGLLQSPVSGLMGLAFSVIAQSGATPFLQTLASSSAWNSPLMAFHLTRFIDDPEAEAEEPGGSFTLGYTNRTLYSGNIEFIDIPPGQASYWLLPMTAVTVQGIPLQLPSGSSSFAAIDTGTTLVGGPSAAISEIYSQIPGSAPGTGNLAGYYTYPCNTVVDVALSFGGSSWPVSSNDFKLRQMSNGNCLGAFFELPAGISAPSWIVGDTFLKNVYSVFRFSPPSVGFAQLSGVASAQNDVQGDAPTPTIGSVAAIVSATGRSDADRAANEARVRAPMVPLAGIMSMVMAVTVASSLLV